MLTVLLPPTEFRKYTSPVPVIAVAPVRLWVPPPKVSAAGAVRLKVPLSVPPPLSDRPLPSRVTVPLLLNWVLTVPPPFAAGVVKAPRLLKTPLLLVVMLASFRLKLPPTALLSTAPFCRKRLVTPPAFPAPSTATPLLVSVLPSRYTV